MKKILLSRWARMAWSVVLLTLLSNGASASSLVTWGPGHWGQTNLPAGLDDVTGIAVGQYHVMALRANGTVAAWGGDGSDYQEVNQVPPDLNNVKAISAGTALSVALRFDGTVVAWGHEGPDGYTNAPAGLNDVVAIAAGGYHGLALRANGRVIGWGQSMAGQITPPADLTNAIAVAAGSHHSLALRADGAVVAFGHPDQGQINVPPGLSNVIAIAAVSTRSLALKADGTVVQWGSYSDGEFAPPPGLSNVVAIAAGFRHTLALRRDGTLVAWGNGDLATIPPGLANVTAIAAGNYVNVALVGPLPVAPLIPRGAVWRYNDTGADEGTAWRAPGFDDSTWPSGRAQLGFGDGDEATLIRRTPSNSLGIVTAYFRRAFVADHVTAVTNLALRLIHDDGAVLYLNGVEAFRVNLPPGTIGYNTMAAGVSVDNAVATANLSPSLLVEGTNVVAVEVHQANISSSDLSFDLELIATGGESPPEPVTLADALDAPELVWREECYFPRTPWTVETGVGHDGIDCAVTSAYDDESSSCDLITEVTGPGVVEFFWKVSNTPPFGTLTVSIGNHYRAAITGEVDWQHRSVFVPPGPQTLVWSYFSGNPVWDETGSGWLDEVHFSRTPPLAPSIVVQPRSQNAREGDDVILSVEAAGTEPFFFQWQKDGSDLPGQTNASLMLVDVQTADGGTYRVRVVNAANTVFSDGAILTVTPPVLVRRSAPRDQVDPAVAASSNLYLVVWTDDRDNDTDYDIYGARVTPDGQVLDPDGIRICTAPYRQEMPAVASDGRDFFVVWQDDRGNVGIMDPELYGARVSADGTVRDPNGILISSALQAQFYPRIAFNGTNYLVVWYDYRFYSDAHRVPDIYGTRVRPDGVVLEPGGLAIAATGNAEWAPTVAALNGDFFVVWGTSEIGVLGTRVTGAGVVVHPGGISISPHHIPNRAPLAANATGYLVIWDDDRNYPATQSDIWGRRIAASGETVLPGELAICNVTNGQYRSALTASANEFFCVWMDARSGYDLAKIFATRITTNGVVTLNGFDLRANPPPRSYDNPAVASCNGEYLVVWPGKEGLGEYGPMDIVGVRVSASGSVYETNGFLISSVTPELPSITWANPADIVYGTELSSAQLNATASAPGSYRYEPPLGSLLYAGTHTLSVIFTPYDTNAYLPASATNTLHVTRAPLTVTADDQTRYEGQVNPTFTASFSGLVAGETPDQWNDIQYLVTPATPDSPPGTYAIEVLDFDPANYNLTRICGTLTVRQARTQPGSVDLSFNSYIGGIVYAVVVLPDGRILIGGGISATGGQPRNGLARLNADGSLDSSFVPPEDFRFSIQSIALYPDGRFMAAGFTAFNEVHHSYLARFNADGSRDATFPLVTNMFWDFNSVAVQGDGKVLVAGARHDGFGSGLLLRFNTDGTLDPSFHSDTGSDANEFSQMAVQSDGRIFVCGSFRVYNGEPSEGVVRLHPDGSLDTSFQPDPIMPSGVASFALLPDGRIVIGGYGTNPDEPARVARLTSDGALDPTFVSMPVVNATIVSMAVQADGRIVIGGAFTEANGMARFGLARLNVNGSLDLTFDPGFGVSGGDNVVNAIAVQSPEFLLIGGEFSTIDQVPHHALARVRSGSNSTEPSILAQPVSRTVVEWSTVTFSVAAVGTPPLSYQWQKDGAALAGQHGSGLALPAVQLADAGGYRVIIANDAGSATSAVATLTVVPRSSGPGSVDLSFDLTRGGELLGLESHRGEIQTLALQPDGKVVVGGEFVGANRVPRYNLARLNPDGTIDPGFNPSCSTDDRVLAAAVQPDGKVLLSGEFAFANTVPRQYVARLNADGSLDPSFDAGLRSLTEGRVYRMVLQPDGRLVIATTGHREGGGDVSQLLRLNSDGSADTDFPARTWTNAYLGALALQPDGQLLVGLNTQLTNQAMIRLNADGTADPTFQPQLAPQHPGWSVSVSQIALQSDGRLIIQGGFVVSVPGAGQRERYARLNADGSVDASFDAGANPPLNVSTMRLQSDGKLLLGIWSGGLIRLNADGSRDYSFDPDSPIPGHQPSVNALALRPDGRIVVGRAYDSHYLEALDCVYQLHPDGGRDTNFSTQIHPAGAVVTSVARQANGQVLIGGRFHHLNGQPLNGIARLNADGSWDAGFRVALKPTDWVSAVVPLASGQTLFSVSSQDADGNSIHRCARLNTDGSADSNFVVNLPYFSPIVIQPDGNILGIGSWDWDDGGWTRTSVVRLHPDGSLDPLFNQGGEGPDGSERSVGTVVLLPDGKIMVGGEYESFNGVPRQGVARLQSDGSLDTDFDLRQMSCAWVSAIAVQNDGKLVLGGQGFYADGGAWLGTVIRVHPDGSRDPSFDAVWMDGVLPHSIVAQSDGRIIVAGNFWNGAEPIRTHNIVRLNPDGSRDTSFDVGAGANGEVWSVLLQPDGQDLIGGYFSAVNGVPRTGIARLNNDLAGPGSFVTRHLSAQQVQLVAAPPVGTSVYAVEDQPPQNWHIEGISHGGTFDARTGKVKFGPFYDAEPRGFSYLVFPPPGTQGVFAFTGTASADGVNTPIAGDQFRVVVGCHPAEVRDNRPPDWRMTIDEVTAYASAWRRGVNWNVPPNPIPIDYVTRAAFLWRGGECYEIDSTATNIPLCWVSCGGSSVQSAAGSVANSPSARRLIPGVFVPGEPLIITLSTTAGTARAYAFEEQCPVGWIVTDISDAGEFDAVSGQVKWGPFYDHTPRTLTYQVTPPPTAAGAVTFDGAASFDGVSAATGGANVTRAACRLSFSHSTSGGSVRISLSGGMAQRFLIEASTDLQTWSPLTVVIIGTGPTEFSDSSASAFSQQFYRAKPAP